MDPTKTTLIPRSALFATPERLDPQLSPDGKRLAYLAPVDTVLNVWVGTVGGDDFAPVTSEAARQVPWFKWAHDGRHLLYVRDTGGDENFHMFKVDLQTGESVDLTP